MSDRENPKYPVFIISKGRWESRLTSKALEKINVPYRIVIEPQEYEQYAAVIDPKKILVLPFSNLGQGSIPARNWVWDTATKEGHERHWILDDNIRGFMRFNRNQRTYAKTGKIFVACEDFTDRYTNVPMSGMNYSMFIPEKRGNEIPPYFLNTRVYSCILLSNQVNFRWRGRYNEDTDLSIRFLKAGYCTILFNAFLCIKIATMKMKGGNTEELYKLNNGQDGRLLMAKSLQAQHPDIVRIIRRFGRWQHLVNYKPFKKNKLIRRLDIAVTPGINEYGMKLTHRHAATQT